MIVSITPLFAPSSSNEAISLDFSETISIPANWNPRFVPSSEFSGKLEIIRMEQDVLVFLKNAEIQGEVECVRCLGREKITISFPPTEQIFTAKRSEDWGEEDFSIDQKNLTIDLTPFFQQELLVHIPSFVHEEGKCDPEMLKKISSFQEEKEGNPFAELKKLYPKEDSLD